jgi:hypothetical protein
MEPVIAGNHSIFDRVPKNNYDSASQRPDTVTEKARPRISVFLRS